MPVPDQVVQWLDRHFPKPRVDPTWLQECYDWLTEDQHMSATNAFPEFMDRVKGQLLESDLVDSMLVGTGLEPGITQVTTKLYGPPVLLQIMAITEMGVSAFQLEQVRVAREERMKTGVGNIEGEEDGDVEVEGEGPMPKYPRGTLRFKLSDGKTTINAIEYKPLPQLTLGITELGYKLQLRGTRIQNGMAFLEPDTVTLLGGKCSELEDAQLSDFKKGLRERLGRPLTPEPTSAEDQGQAAVAQAVRSPLREISHPPVLDFVQQHTDDIDMEPRRRIPEGLSINTPASGSSNQVRPIAPLPSRNSVVHSIDDGHTNIRPSRAQRATLAHVGSKDMKGSASSRYFDSTTNNLNKDKAWSKSSRDLAISEALKDLDFSYTPHPHQLLRTIPSSPSSRDPAANDNSFGFEQNEIVDQAPRPRVHERSATAREPLFLPDTPPAMVDLLSDDYGMIDDIEDPDYWDDVDKVLEVNVGSSSNASKAKNSASSPVVSRPTSSAVSSYIMIDELSRSATRTPASGASGSSSMPIDVIEIIDSDEDMGNTDDKENQPVPTRHVRQRMSNDYQVAGRGFGATMPPMSQRTDRSVVLATNAENIIDLSDSD